MKKRFTFLILCILTLNACSSTKSLKTPVSISLQFQQELIIEGNDNTKYLFNYDKVFYQTKFLNELNSYLNKRDITISKSGNYQIIFTELNLKEISLLAYVEDENSDQNGQKYSLKECSGDLSFQVNKGSVLIKNKTVLIVINEEISNLRSWVDYFFGLNKDYTNYHLKELDEDTFAVIIEKLASKTGKKITETILRNE